MLEHVLGEQNIKSCFSLNTKFHSDVQSNTRCTSNRSQTSKASRLPCGITMFFLSLPLSLGLLPLAKPLIKWAPAFESIDSHHEASRLPSWVAGVRSGGGHQTNILQARAMALTNTRPLGWGWGTQKRKKDNKLSD